MEMLPVLAFLFIFIPLHHVAFFVVKENFFFVNVLCIFEFGLCLVTFKHQMAENWP